MNPVRMDANLQLGSFHLDIDLQIPNHGVTAIIGRSGAGKTTLLRWIAGFHRGNKSYLEVADKIWEDSKRNIFVPAHKRSVGYVFQEYNLLPHLSVKANLEFAIKRLTEPLEEKEFRKLTNTLGVETLLKRQPYELSGGERQRVALLRSLLKRPKILLLDEPLSALDEFSKNEILPYLEIVKEENKIPILLVSHSLKEVKRLADQVLQIENGIASHRPLNDGLLRNSDFDLPPALSFVGHSGSGKTTLIEGVIPILKKKGYRLAVIKHDAHDFQIDHEGKDTYRFFHAGADSIMISSRNKIASVSKLPEPTTIENMIAQHFREYDLVLSEGYKQSRLPKILVTRGAQTKDILPLVKAPVLAFATDNPDSVPRDLLLRDSIFLNINNHEQVAQFIIDWIRRMKPR